MAKEEIRDKIISIVSQIHDCVENVKILDYKPEENLNKIIELINVDLTNIAQSLTPKTVDVEDYLNWIENEFKWYLEQDNNNSVVRTILVEGRKRLSQQPKEQKEVSDKELDKLADEWADYLDNGTLSFTEWMRDKPKE